MIKLDKDRIRQLALQEFHNKYHESVYDVWTDALTAWLGEQGYEIVTKEVMDSLREFKELVDTVDEVGALIKKVDTEREAESDADQDSEEPKD